MLQVVVDKPEAVGCFLVLQQFPDQDRQRNDALAFSFGGLDSKMFTEVCRW